jgi:hypothetical protein
MRLKNWHSPLSRFYSAFSRLFPAICLTVFILQLAGQLHGFSLASWGRTMGDDSISKTLVGLPRSNRSDDWAGALPLILSQTQSVPSFPIVNRLVHPDGQDMRLGVSVPTKSWSVVFKPQVWGYFISPDFGLSWHWNLRVLLLLLASFYFFRSFFGASVEVGAFGSMALVSSSFFAYWSFISEPLTGFALLSGTLLLRLITRRHSPAQSLGLAAILTWTLGCFCISNLYPPFQIPLIYFVAALLLPLVVSAKRSRFGILMSAVAVVGALSIVAIHFWESSPTLQALLNTDYPGKRFAVGGDLSLGRLFLLTMLPLNTYSSFIGIGTSEAGSSYMAGVAGLLAFVMNFRSSRESPVGKGLAVVTIGLCIYCFLGVPSLVARLSGFYLVPSGRTLGLWSLLNIAWLVWWLEKDTINASRMQALVASVVTFCALMSCGLLSMKQFPQLSADKVLSSSLLLSIVVFYFFQRRSIAAIATLAILMVGSIWFNPVDRMTYTRIRNSPISRELLANFKESGKTSLIFSDGEPFKASLPRMLGIPSLGGMHVVPQKKYWSSLGPDPTNSPLYNRFAYVSFVNQGPDTPLYSNSDADILTVNLSAVEVPKEQFSSSQIRQSLPRQD